MRPSLKSLIINTLFIMLILNACAPSPAGYLLIKSWDEVFAVSKGAETKGEDELRILGPGVTNVAVSPLKRYLIYSLENITRLRDLNTGDEEILLQGITCFSWSKSDSMLSYVVDEEQLYVQQISTGKKRLVYTAPSETVQEAYSGMPTGKPFKAFADMTCGVWISEDRLLFERHVGSLLKGGDLTTEVNMSTIAVLEDDVTLLDAPQPLIVRDISSDGAYILFQGMDTGEAYLSPAFTDFGDMKLHKLPSEKVDWEGLRHDLRFVPNSHKVSDLRSNWDEDGNDYETRIYFIDAETLEERRGPKFPEGWSSWIWIGDPGDNLIAVVEDNESQISIIDLDTGRRTVIVEGQLYEDLASVFDPTSQSKWRSSPDIVAWVSP